MVTATVHWHAAQGLQRLDHRGQTPGVDVLLEFLFESLEAFGVFVNRPDVCLQDDVLRGRGTDHFGEPSESGPGPSEPGPRSG